MMRTLMPCRSLLAAFPRLVGSGDSYGVPGKMERLLAGFTSLVGVVAFLLAAYIDPYENSGQARTHGVHQQLGLPPCALLTTLGFPCPSCGMTTSVSLMVHGDPAAAWHANAAGVFVSLAGAVAVIWLGMLSVGVPRCQRLSAESAVLYLTVGGAMLVMVRYVTLIGPVLLGIADG